MNQTLEQKRAKYALDAINKAKEKKGNGGEDYGRHVRKLPAMILNNGLGQVLASLLADDEGKEQEASWQLYQDLQSWLCKKENPRCICENGKLITSLIDNDRSQYLHAQDEALKLLVWMKKFADAYLPKPGGR
jgi:CRISPR-associated protein Cmr5